MVLEKRYGRVQRFLKKFGRLSRVARKRDLKVLDPDFKKRVSSVLSEVRDSLYELHDVAVRDEKTGIYNYRFFKNVFAMELEKARRGQQKLCLVVIDIDFFKKFNDEFGHLVGDEVLISLAKTLSGVLRTYDVLARFGGEEFFVFLPYTSKTLAMKVAERMRKSLTKNAKLKKYGVTISLGVTEYKQRDTMERMIRRADKALYVSKKDGRDRVSFL
jgi:diguanylate cyclase (GGDEF)-like protein